MPNLANLKMTWQHRSHTGGVLALLFLFLGLALLSLNAETQGDLAGQTGVGALLIAAIFTVGYGIMRRMDRIIVLLRGDSTSAEDQNT